MSYANPFLNTGQLFNFNRRVKNLLYFTDADKLHLVYCVVSWMSGRQGELVGRERRQTKSPDLNTPLFSSSGIDYIHEDFSFLPYAQGGRIFINHHG